MEEKNEKLFYYQKITKALLIPLYIFDFESFKSLKTVDKVFKEVIYDTSLQDDWKIYYNLQIHQYDVER